VARHAFGGQRIADLELDRLLRMSNRLVETVLHEHLVPDTQHWWMDVHHDAIRRRKLPQPFRLGAVEENAFRGVAVALRHRNRLGAAPADHLLDDRPTALFERVRVGHQRELAGIDGGIVLPRLPPRIHFGDRYRAISSCVRGRDADFRRALSRMRAEPYRVRGSLQFVPAGRRLEARV
jgi:hypothetical protein